VKLQKHLNHSAGRVETPKTGGLFPTKSHTSRRNVSTYVCLQEWTLNKKIMKKLLLILVAVISIAISANAGVIFRSQQSVCSGSEQIIFKSNGAVQVWKNSTLLYSGTYTIEGNIIIMSVEGGQFRGKAEMNDSKTNLWNITIDGVKYTRCNQ
jgi:hypothetical protein